MLGPALPAPIMDQIKSRGVAPSDLSISRKFIVCFFVPFAFAAKRPSCLDLRINLQRSQRERSQFWSAVRFQTTVCHTNAHSSSVTSV